MKLGSNTPAVVTGGASGLGRATAEALAAQGVKVAIFDIQEEKGEEVAKAIGGVFCNVNILDEASCEAGFAVGRRFMGCERADRGFFLCPLLLLAFGHPKSPERSNGTSLRARRARHCSFRV